jgi:hypothetical protein
VKKLGLITFNILLAVALAALYARIVVEPTWEAAALSSWWAGLLAGATVGAGAALGPRPVLGWKKCVHTQIWIVLTSALFVLVLGLLPNELKAMDVALEAEMERRGLRWSSGLGAAVGTVIQILQVYFSRRRAARRP